MCLLKLLVETVSLPEGGNGNRGRSFFLLRYLQVNNLCPTLKSRENQCVALLCEPSWDMSIVWGKLSFNRFGFHMAFRDVVRHWTRHSKLRWASRLFFPLSLLGSSNNMVQMWGFHPAGDKHPALWLERQRCEWHLILLSDSPKMIFPHAFYGFSLHLWCQPKTSHTLRVEFWAPKTVTQMLLQRRKDPDLLKGLADDFP